MEFSDAPVKCQNNNKREDLLTLSNEHCCIVPDHCVFTIRVSIDKFYLNHAFIAKYR